MATPRTKQRIDLLRGFAKKEQASRDVTDLGLITRVYAKAIAFGGMGGEMLRGLSQAIAIGMGVICFWGSSVYLGGLAVAPGVTHAAVVIFSFVGALFFLWAYTLTFFLPEDDSVIFDRGSRQVHWVSMQLAGKTRLAALKRPVIEVRSADWTLIDAEHRAIVKVNTAGASRSHDLAFVVRKSATDATAVDEFGIAPSMMLSETTVPALWEHIRRYMEEGGPPWSPGVTEPAPFIAKPRNWWQSMGLVGPFGPKYFQWWKKHPGLTLAVHLLLPITVPTYLLWSLLNWLSYATEQKVIWPQKVLDTLGPVLTDDEVRAGKGGKLVAR